MIKFKRSNVFFSLFVSAFGWFSSLWFERPGELDCQSSHQWRGVDSRKSCCWLVRRSLWNKLTSFLRCWTAEAGSQVISSQPSSRDLIDVLILTSLHRPHYTKLPLLHTPHYCRYCQTLFVWLFYPPVPSWWCLTSVVTCRKHHKFSIS